MKKYLLLFLGFSLMGRAQNCAQNLEEAQIAFFNGRFHACVQLLHACWNTYENKEDKETALEVLSKSYLMLGETSAAEESMYKLLLNNPFYQARKDLSLSLDSLYHKFELVRSWQAGFSLSYAAVNYSILKTWSFSGVAEDPAHYDPRNSLQSEAWFSYRIYKNWYLESGIAYQSLNFYRSEVQQNYLLQSSLENLQFISPRLGFAYAQPLKNWSFFANCGASVQCLYQAKADMGLEPQMGEIPAAFAGYPERQEAIDLNFQRRNLIPNSYAGIGLRYGKGYHCFELSYRFQYAWHNLTVADERYSNENLLNNLAYVPDDFSFSYGLWQIGYLYSFIKPEKK